MFILFCILYLFKSSGNTIADILDRLPQIMATINQNDYVILFWDSDCSNIDETLLTIAEVIQLRKAYVDNIQQVIDGILNATPFLAVAGPEILGEGPIGMQHTGLLT